MKKIIISIILLLSITSSVMASTDVVNKVFPAMVLIVMEDKNGNEKSIGSGFLVSPNVIATNFHVIENAYSGHVKLVNKDEVYEIDGVVGYSAKYDLALIKIGHNNGTPLTLKSPSVDIGQKIFAIGNPLGLEGTISDGIISGLRDFEDLSLLQISAPISPGNSGGPIVDENGDIIGVATYSFAGGQNLNFAIPVEYLKELFNNQTPLVTLSSLVKVKQPPSKKTSIDFGGISITKLSVIGYMMDYDGFSLKFTLNNNLSKGIKNIQAILIVYDVDGEMLDYSYNSFFTKDCLPGKFSKRQIVDLPSTGVKYLQSEGLVKDEQDMSQYYEFRILDFTVCTWL